jgi:hypothetical protein
MKTHHMHTASAGGKLVPPTVTGQHAMRKKHKKMQQLLHMHTTSHEGSTQRSPKECWVCAPKITRRRLAKCTA